MSKALLLHHQMADLNKIQFAIMKHFRQAQQTFSRILARQHEAQILFAQRAPKIQTSSCRQRANIRRVRSHSDSQQLPIRRVKLRGLSAADDLARSARSIVLRSYRILKMAQDHLNVVRHRRRFKSFRVISTEPALPTPLSGVPQRIRAERISRWRRRAGTTRPRKLIKYHAVLPITKIPSYMLPDERSTGRKRRTQRGQREHIVRLYDSLPPIEYRSRMLRRRGRNGPVPIRLLSSRVRPHNTGQLRALDKRQRRDSRVSLVDTVAEWLTGGSKEERQL